MSLAFLEALDGAEHEQIEILQDPAIGFYAIVALHDTSAGPAFGGVRRHRYRNGAEALRDALLLSRAMTYKCVMAGVPGGGGKTVLLDHPELDAEKGYQRLGRFVENLGGRYYTGPDIGTGPRELAWIGATTRFVTRPDATGPGDLGRATARGLFSGIRAVCRHLGPRDARFPTEPDAQGLEGLRVLIQGLGEVGMNLAGMLHEAGARVLAAEVDADRLGQAVDLWGVEPVPHEAALETDCELWAPCALGGLLHDLTVGRLRCAAIAGSANNLLARPEVARMVHDRGVLLAPDYVVNSGALILGANFHLTGDRDQDAAIDRIGDELLTLFERAEREGLPPSELADRIASERLHARRGAPWFPAADLDVEAGR
ncbi:MAG: Glu/Leu/Phe/Val dehydrogenase dimerization domain-containing protein [Planctomycetota bacterium]